MAICAHSSAGCLLERKTSHSELIHASEAHVSLLPVETIVHITQAYHRKPPGTPLLRAAFFLELFHSNNDDLGNKAFSKSEYTRSFVWDSACLTISILPPPSGFCAARLHVPKQRAYRDDP